MNPEANAANVHATQENSKRQFPSRRSPAREPVEHVLHGDRRVDHYAWLRHKETPKSSAYLKAENAYTDAILKPTERFQEKSIRNAGAHPATDLSVSLRAAWLSLFHATEKESSSDPLPGGATRRRGRRTVLDLNALAEGHSFLGLDSFEVSEDNHLLAYSTDTTGFRHTCCKSKTW